MCTVNDLISFIWRYWGITKINLCTPHSTYICDSSDELPPDTLNYIVYGFTYNETSNLLTIRAKERIYG